MKKFFHSSAAKIIVLLLAVLLVCTLYLSYKTYGNWAFALELRGKKLLAFIFVGVAAAFSTISFQTMTQNHFLTPNILGLDSLYVFIQTLLFFILGGQQLLGKETIGTFLINVLLMVAASIVLSRFLLRKGSNDLFLLLMIGIILGTFFNSISTFLQVVMDPNEYDLLQGKLFASFGNVNSQHLMIAGVLITLLVGFLWMKSATLDVLHLGNDQATSLGVDVPRFQFILLTVISGLIGLSTALVGPVTFLGFIVANMSYQLMGTYRHRDLFLGGSLLSILLLVFGQFLVEQVFQLNTTLSIVIEFGGGLYFVGKIISERKQRG
ncbi:iron chelate uptake ABC transporter family permease subunit [Enterococcus sp. DIV0242_7C1]|uniref:Iron compound ABC transporter permease n=1 Tax=Candidatus Enterococcus dunnyi TaxID=1834192 RepID=A0A200J107_9ENTE|nr:MULTISPECIES: iron chelate uptake ABC transporter family permease subunit [unclassified Enterococcus]MBO0470051.1 iron chelate uptake ABC transporter family permease subunit [Enterococcus sp. DIV0242_7C1]MCA5013600.1 iron chelate uptake ABC transporter family permease subunit [Enterococcus sp. S23]MCA5016850.1 iron chelate uptake ABC transporter family permease subunit [Enterococcus sp. S22(2020)]OUZ30501.1 iron compound ABC transporter permease [Enterococcus sp. 9D6_DIV0238]